MNRLYRNCFKRCIDFILALIALIVLFIPMVVLYFLVKCKLGSPVFFVQERPGKDEKIFKILKFRTMTNERDENGELLPDEQRLTKFGKFLRTTSLDELPQLINIIKGDMAIVGPRALLVEYLPMYTPEQRIRHTVRPGLTNSVAIHGRNEVPMEQKLQYDIEYVQNMSFVLDCYIILKTVLVVLQRKGTQLEEKGKMKDYAGSREEDQ